ncbi:fumarylacetoacetase [Formosa sp. Hel1_33_131]|uniref:fumarylacetoacetase n=1 Tax=Formosa sp. Hel1_33_131 TaxID=1336794 RepID=UPI00084E258C|nr:fumarylacetoacetase [Formosa sp. Hel1_33_131]AOR27133.1 fumarylacetoacetase [Formosa sp. Hel1_33_131]
MQSWIKIDNNSDFSIYNLPFGIFSESDHIKRVGVAIGDKIVDVYAAFELGVFKDLDFDITVLESEYLNDFIALGKSTTVKIREYIQVELCNENSVLKSHPSVFIKQSSVQMHLPVKVGDYTDFYSSIEHATNIGTMFRDPDNALLPNWKHLPVGYHGRASSIIVSGENVHRPKGQVVLAPNTAPVFQASTRVDFELEMGFIIGKSTKLGDSVSTDAADEYIFGKVLFNDWSARDIQKWEYVPLGPFLAKSFASSMSPWVVTLEALEPFKIDGPKQEPTVLPYLNFKGSKNYDINLEVSIQPENCKETVVSHSNFKYMYWNMNQQLAHHTVNGCNLNVGDLMASGTISGKSPDSYGSMLELSWAGSKPVELLEGGSRKFIQDNDTVIMRGHCQKGEIRVGFGAVKSTLLKTT